MESDDAEMEAEEPFALPCATGIYLTMCTVALLGLLLWFVLGELSTCCGGTTMNHNMHYQGRVWCGSAEK